LEKKIIDSFATQVRLSATVVLMRDLNQKTSVTDKRIAIALQRSVLLSYLLSLGAISAGGLSTFSVAAILGTKPAQANMKEQPASLLNQTVIEEQALPNSSRSSEYTCPVGYHQDLVKGKPSQTTEKDLQTTADITRSQQTSEQLNLNGSETSEALTSKADAPYVATAAPSALQDLCKTDGEKLRSLVPDFQSLGESQNSNLLAQISEGVQPTTVMPAMALSLTAGEPVLKSVERNEPEQLAVGDEPTTGLPRQAPDAIALEPALNSVERNVSEQLAVGNQPTTVAQFSAPTPTTDEPALNSVERNVSAPVAVGEQPTTTLPAKAPTPTTDEPAVYRGPGGASLLGGNIQAQSSVENQRVQPQNSSRFVDPLAPSLLFQGVVLNQGDTAARARLSGMYPISPNALFGATVDLTTGDGFSDSPGGGLQLNELYFTGSLPSLPSVRLTTGLVDLTSYFDRNSFAKDSTTHFFNPVFQTNPALAAAGIGSRPAALLNWDITDNLQARAAAFSSARNLGDFAVDGFAGELAFRAGNGIIRGTFASARDARRDGFREIFGIDRGNNEFGPRSSDRENAYGVNAEYFIPELKMGLFGRYGRYENTSIGRGGDTFSLGLNFLDLFMQDDRLGFGYGRNLSNNDLRRASGAKIPDVWELFYDFRIAPYLRAAVTLQARDAFSDVIAGFRVKTEFDLLGRLFR
jgi:hypothetical protein